MIKKLLITKDKIIPTRSDFKVLGAFNPGCTMYNGETILLIRVSECPVQDSEKFYHIPIYDYDKDEIVKKTILRDDGNYDFSDLRVIKNCNQNYLTSISHFRLAKSKDGINFKISDTPTILPGSKYEEYGIEDSRITLIDDTYYITYSAISSLGLNVGLIKTKDFISFERIGNIFHSDNKDAVIFPEKINGKYYALHRPSLSLFGKLDIWIAESDNLLFWGNHRHLAGARLDSFDNYRLGAGTVPFLTPKGWLEIYHCADKDNVYCLAALLLDKDNPNKIIARSKKVLIAPEMPFEKCGFFNNVIFTCGLVASGDKVRIYYGVCDENIACADLSLNEIYENLGV